MKRPAPSQKKQRRQRVHALREADILTAARAVFTEKGYEAATMDEVARWAEYTKRTLYAYFPSKDDLLLALLETILSGMVARIEAEAACGQSGAEKLSRIGHARLALFREDRGAFSLFGLRTSFPRDVLAGQRFQRLRRLNERLHAGIAEAFAAGVKDGSVRANVNPQMAALFVTSVSSGMLQVVAQQGSLFEKIYGVTPDAFIGYCMQMIGASFLTRNEHLGTAAGPPLPAQSGHKPSRRKQ